MKAKKRVTGLVLAVILSFVGELHMLFNYHLFCFLLMVIAIVVVVVVLMLAMMIVVMMVLMFTIMKTPKR